MVDSIVEFIDAAVEALDKVVKFMTEEIKKAIEGLGALAELLKMFYDMSMQAGFSKEHSIYLTGVYMHEVLGGSSSDKNPGT